MADFVVSERVLRYLDQLGHDVITPYFCGKKKLKEVEKNLKIIQALDIDQKDKAALKEKLKKLKQLVYQMEDLLEDKYIWEKHKDQQVYVGGKLTKSISILGLKPYLYIKFIKLDQQIRVLMRNLKDSCPNVVVSSPKKNGNDLENPSFMLKDKVIGRDEEIKALMDDLSSKNTSEYVIHVLGMDGVGKTSLVQEVLKNEEVVKNFDAQCWVSLSEDLDYGTNEAMKQIGVINDKKCLLILDQVETKINLEWLQMWHSLVKKESKIIVISRHGHNVTIPLHNWTTKSILLKGLAMEPSLKLLRTIAFKPEEENEEPCWFSEIGRKIVETCYGIPLLIRIIAGTLYGKNKEHEWEQFYEKIQSIRGDTKNGCVAILKLAYDHLNPQLRQCFAYCSLFPYDYVFNENDLSHIWMAQGFIEENHDQKVGHKYFMELLRRNFFQYSDSIKGSYKMHRLIHAFAKEVAKDDCLFDDHKMFIVGSPSWKAPLDRLATKRCRSLFIFPRQLDKSVTITNIEELLSSMRYLRVMDLGKIHDENLLNSIGQLKYLRYLKVGGSFKNRPKCITKLVCLQSLNINGCYQSIEGENGLNKLVNTIDCKSLTSQYPENLSFHFLKENEFKKRIQDLSKFPCDFLKFVEIEGCNGYEGPIPLSGLSSLTSLKLLNLRDLKYIEKSGSGNIDHSSEYLSSLEILKMEELPVLTQWIKEDDGSIYFPKLSKLKIHHCPKMVSMPKAPLLVSLNVEEVEEKFLQDLLDGISEKSSATSSNSFSHSDIRFKKLKIASIVELKDLSLSKKPPQESLRIKRCENLTNLTCSIRFPKSLEVSSCGKLLISGALQHLEELMIWQCEKLEFDLKDHLTQLRSLSVGNIDSIPTWVNSVTTLERLKMIQVWDMITWPLSNWHLPKLQHLQIVSCPSLNKIEQFQSTTSLELLEIGQCGQMMNISANELTIQDLVVKDCDELRLWCDLKRLSNGKLVIKSLKTLTLQNILKFKSFPFDLARRLTMLEELKLYHLQNLKTLSLPLEFFTQLHLLELVNCPELVKVTSLGELEGMSINQSSLTLKIRQCDNLKNISCEKLAIKELIVEDCDELQSWGDEKSLSSISHSLMMQNMLKLKSISLDLSYSPMLGTFSFSQLPSLTNLDVRIGHITWLEWLGIIDCPKLEKISISIMEGNSSIAGESQDQQPALLKNLTIERCQELISMNVMVPSSINLDLDILQIRQCHKMKDIHFSSAGLVVGYLEIDACDELLHCLWDEYDDHQGVSSTKSTLPSSNQECLKNLQYLKLSNLSKLESLPKSLQDISSLTHLGLFQLPNLRTTPECIDQLSQLKYLQVLHIWECPLLKILPDSLEKLTYIKDLHIENYGV